MFENQSSACPISHVNFTDLQHQICMNMKWYNVGNISPMRLAMHILPSTKWLPWELGNTVCSTHGHAFTSLRITERSFVGGSDNELSRTTRFPFLRCLVQAEKKLSVLLWWACHKSNAQFQEGVFQWKIVPLRFELISFAPGVQCPACTSNEKVVIKKCRYLLLTFLTQGFR